MTRPDDLTLFLAGDVMLGRGVDQILPHPCPPEIFEAHAASALDYVRLAEWRNGPIPRPVAFHYVWGDGLAELASRRPDLRLVNLETAVTLSDTPAPKGINYRMSPENVGALGAAGLRACTLANNHVLDWGPEGLEDTLRALAAAGIAAVGAGRDAEEARAPVVHDVPGKGRVIVLAFGSTSSGIPRSWAAQPQAPGVNLLPEQAEAAVEEVRRLVAANKRAGDVVVVSLHWGGNWGYRVSLQHQSLARRLVDEAGVDLVHGHSSHHPRGIEVHHGKLILYGCGDLINDYEGISGYEAYRDDLTLMYFPRLAAADGRLLELAMVPFRIRAMRLERARRDAAEWLAETFNREAVSPAARVELRPDATLRLVWS